MDDVVSCAGPRCEVQCLATVQTQALGSVAYDDRIDPPTKVGCGALDGPAQTYGAR